MHPDELTVTPALVRALVDAQFPHWRGQPLTPVEPAGTVNAIVRIGDRWVARFPLRPDDAEEVRQALVAEADAARVLRGRVRCPVPEPVALGRPGAGYPLPWSVQTWLPGRTAEELDPGRSTGFARDLAGLIGDLRAIGTGGRTFRGSGRGGDLRDQDDWLETCFGRSAGLLDVPRLRRLWSRLRALPREDPDVTTHGDLIPGNVLVSAGRLAGLLDVGGLGPADPALDLVGAWHLLEDGPREVLRAGLGCPGLTWERGKAWAFAQAMGLVWYYADSNPALSRTGRRTLDRLLATEPA